MKKIAAFIDGANLYAGVKTIGLNIDYTKVLKFLRDRGQLVRASYYTALIEDQEFSTIRPLVDWLEYNGYNVVTKSAKQFTDAMGRVKTKGNMDIELAIDMLEAAQYADEIVLFSGDGDFRRLVEAVQRKGVRVTVISTLAGAQPMIADELRRQADEFIDLEKISTLIQKENDHEKAITTASRTDNPIRIGLRHDRNRVTA